MLGLESLKVKVAIGYAVVFPHCIILSSATMGVLLTFPKSFGLVKHTFCLRHVSYAKIEIPIKIYRAGKVPIRDEIFCKIRQVIPSITKDYRFFFL